MPTHLGVTAQIGCCLGMGTKGTKMKETWEIFSWHGSFDPGYAQPKTKDFCILDHYALFNLFLDKIDETNPLLTHRKAYANNWAKVEESQPSRIIQKNKNKKSLRKSWETEDLKIPDVVWNWV